MENGSADFLHLNSVRTMEQWHDDPDSMQGLRMAKDEGSFLESIQCLLEKSLGARRDAVSGPCIERSGYSRPKSPPRHTTKFSNLQVAT